LPQHLQRHFWPGTTVSLSQTPASGWNFLEWDGACMGNGGCSVTMSANQNVIATFWTDGSSSPAAARPPGVSSVAPGPVPSLSALR